MKKNYYLLLITLFSSIFNYSNAQQSTMGTDFWMGFTYAFQPGETGTVYKIYISSVTGATGTVSAPLNAYSVPFTVAANSTVVITVPYAKVQNETSESVQPKGVHIVSNNPVSVSASMYSIVRPEATIVMPTELLGTRYYVASYPGFWYGQSGFEIVATQNATSIQITPSGTTMGNKAAGSPFTITLDSGQVYLVRAKNGFTNAGTDDMTGSLITGSDLCKPFAVFASTPEAYVPTSCGTADPLYEELQPVGTWGTDYIVPPFFSSTGCVSRIVASQNNTSVIIDGGAPIMLNAGQFNEQSFNGSAHCITADKPIEVSQIMKGNTCSGATPNKGDPSMIILSSNDQFMTQAVFTPYNNLIAARYVNVVMKTAYVSQLMLDGVAVGAGKFTTTPCSAYSYATLAVTNAFHTLFADSGFVGYVHCYGSGDEAVSYGLGYAVPAPVITVAGSTSICAGVNTILTASGGATYIWSQGGATTATITVSPTTTTTYTVTATTTGSCINIIRTFTLNVTNCGSGPSVQFQSSDSAFCDESGKCIDFTDLTTGNPTSWIWNFPGAVPDTSTMQNPTSICYYNPGTYSVKLVASNSFGSDSLTISPLITFGSGASLPVITLSHDTIFCSHASAYQWFLSGSPITGATDSFYVPIQDGSYNVQITDNIGCVRLGNSVTFVQVNELNNSKEIEIYPNPAKDWFEVSGIEVAFTGTIDLYNVLGEKVYEEQILPANYKLQRYKMNVLSLSKGVYFVQLKVSDKVFRARLIKE